MAKTYDVYIANNIFDITCANIPADRYHGPFLHLSEVSESSLEFIKAVANVGEIAVAYMANEESVVGI